MKLINIIVLFIGMLFYNCIGGGTHGAIKSYSYRTSKQHLEQIIREVIAKNSCIKQDSIKDYYNDDTNYVTISILRNQELYKYTFRYYGDEEYWDTSDVSSIFIAYAHDEKGYGGSSGNGGVKWSDFELKKRLTEPFEKEFVMKIDSILKMKHTEE